MSSNAWNKTSAPDARMNKMTIISDTGANLNSLDKTKHRVVFCTATGSGLTLNHLYVANAAGDTWLDWGIGSGVAGSGIIADQDEEWLYADLFLSRTDDLKKDTMGRSCDINWYNRRCRGWNYRRKKY